MEHATTTFPRVRIFTTRPPFPTTPIASPVLRSLHATMVSADNDEASAYATWLDREGGDEAEDAEGWEDYEAARAAATTARLEFIEQAERELGL